MTKFTTKTAMLTALIAMGSMMSASAHANVLRTADGNAVHTTGGNCVYTDHIDPTQCDNDVAFDKERTIYFGFNSSKLTAEGKHKLDHLVAGYLPHEHGKGKKHHHKHEVKVIEEMTIVGYADRIGTKSYNEKLAMKRAKTVQSYLVGKGIRPKKVEVRSLGDSAPRTDCPNNLPRKKLIHCLREDRRVEVRINGQ
jgi:outer membrane protein OmpA-like peptidoglycan-associated protein